MSRYVDPRAGFPKPQQQPQSGGGELRRQMDEFKAMLRNPHPMKRLMDEREAEVLHELGGDDIKLAMEGNRAIIRLGQKEIARIHARLETELSIGRPLTERDEAFMRSPEGTRREDVQGSDKPAKPPRMMVSPAAMLRATTELRRWHDKLMKLRAQAHAMVAEDLKLLEERLNATQLPPEYQPAADDYAAAMNEASRPADSHAPPVAG